MDIVERLRTESPSYVLIGDAAVEIDRLREEIEEKNKRIDQYLGFIGYSVTKSVLQDHGLWQPEDE